MANLLTMPRADWWPVDKVMLTYLGAVTTAELLYWSSIPHALERLITHLIGILIIVLVANVGRTVLPSALLRFTHYWYPLPYISYCYKEMGMLIPALGRPDADAALARLDFAIWGANPTVWLERLRSPILAEALEIVYSGFVPVVLLVAFLLWKRRRFCEFRYYAFLIAFGFLVSYVGYFLVPARGPRFLLRHLQTYDLHGIWLFDWLSMTLDRIESAHYDCFPSGHTEMTILAWWGSRLVSATLFRVMFAYTLGVIFATVYLRYHYTVDVLAGVVVASALILTTPMIYQTLGGNKRGLAPSVSEGAPR
jgi:membrane-associated phospholipid phosphatase